MRRALLVFAGLLLAGTAHAEEVAPEDRAFVAVEVEPARPFVGQIFHVRLRFGVDRDWFADHAVALFPQEMDVPVQVRAPWTAEVDGTRDPELPVVSTDGARFVLGDAVASATPLPAIERGGRSYAVFVLERAFEATRAGTLDFRAPALRFAYATAFEEDFVGGRIAVDSTTVRVEGESRSVVVRSLPAAGRPDAFSDAVGQFEVSAMAIELSSNIGGGVHLVVRITGDGNLWTLSPPRFDFPAGLHMLGVTHAREGAARLFTYEFLPPAADVREIPALPFAWFDPTPPGQYRVVHTEPLPLEVHRPESGAATGAGPDASGAFAEPEPGLWSRLRNCGIMLLLATIVGLWVRHRWPRVPAPGGGASGIDDARPEPAEQPGQEQAEEERQARTRAAAAAARSALGSETALEAFTAFLAAGLDVSSGAVVGPDLDARLRAAGIPADVSGRTTRVIEQGTAARYGGPAPEAMPDEDLIAALQEAFESA